MLLISKLFLNLNLRVRMSLRRTHQRTQIMSRMNQRRRRTLATLARRERRTVIIQLRDLIIFDFGDRNNSVYPMILLQPSLLMRRLPLRQRTRPLVTRQRTGQRLRLMTGMTGGNKVILYKKKPSKTMYF